jgi:Spy/CpxP family protein refolding chaperone
MEVSMKKSIRLKLLAYLLIIGTWGCSQTNEVEPVKPVNFDSPQFIIIDNDDLLNGIEDATLDSELKLSSSLFSFGILSLTNSLSANDPKMRGIPWLENFDFSKQLGLIFRKLNLTETQVTNIRALMKTYHESLKPLLKEFQDANKEIVKAANEKRRLIMDDLKNNKITRQEASEAIKKLNLETRQMIKDNPDSVRIRDLICMLNKKLMEDIKALLTADQIVKWDLMIKRIQLPC